MASDVEWKEVSLGEVIELKRGYDLPKDKRIPGSVPIVSSSGVSDFHAESMVKGPGVVTGRYGTIGEVFYVDEDYWPLNTTLYVRDFKGNDPRFISYLLRTLDFQAYSDKGAVPGLNRNHLHLARVRIPGKSVQRSIAQVLSSVDSKIDLNCSINETLEAMAQAIFKSWFVDFDPVKAKIAALQEGRDPLRAAMSAISGKSDAELDRLPPEQYDPLAATAALFPDEMEESALRQIPKGWSHQTLAKLTDKIGSGATPRGGKEVYLADGVALIRSQNVYDSLFVWDGLARISNEAATQLKGVTVQEDDVLLNITGASILRTCVVEPDVLPARVNQHVAIIRAKAGVPPRFIHMHLLRPDIKSYLLGLNAGASREAITKGHIESLTLLTPGPELLAAFQTATDPLFRQAQRFAQQMRVLGELRDTLLPKLLSGELAVEAPTEAAGTA
ncbi:restriction endonuclease subunit S [Cupriavidus campinensis]